MESILKLFAWQTVQTNAIRANNMFFMSILTNYNKKRITKKAKPQKTLLISLRVGDLITTYDKNSGLFFVRVFPVAP